MSGLRGPAVAVLVAAAIGVGCGDDSLDSPQGDPVAGERLVQSDVVDPSCGDCHSLAAAEFAGDVAPNLDDMQPGYQRVLDALRRGPGAMPDYGELSDRQLHDIAAYVSEVARDGD